MGDEAVLRELRLEALTDAPDAFGSTYERELARTVEDWRRWLSPGATFILDDRHAPCGLVACARDATAPTIVELMAMWVHPKLRGSGAADALVTEVIASQGAGGFAGSHRFSPPVVAPYGTPLKVSTPSST